MINKVEVWYMTEEERLAYIEKYPIRRKAKKKREAFDNIHTDYKWRGKKAADNRRK
ncbi:hypothetical protein QNH20_19275 [Neobacillus sp. WH10]|uniref:hypothetical protein n=1 Tax=Neobacillus sp. WH10 TaxID=3047873 RepID=UPI0024C135E4|nr:hypothetical protein [Neobacillus sp. WH10]WHY76248.1 hypothetical protein QNH20_19275 [Neobacillus sp. WH10]